MKKSLLLGILVAVQLLASLLGQLLILRFVGVGTQTDAYVAAQSVPLVLGAIVIAALQSVWLPKLAVSSSGLENWRREQSVAQGQAAILGGGLVLLLTTSVYWWFPLLFPGFTGHQQQEAIGYSIVLLFASAVNIQSALLTVALRAKDRFLAAELLAMTGTLFALIAIYCLVPSRGLVSAVWIMLSRSVLVYISQLAIAGWPPISISRGWASSGTWRLMAPPLFGASIYKTSLLVDRYWASQAPAGGVTILGLAQTAMAAISAILDRAFCIPLIPQFSRYAAECNYRALRNSYRRGVLKIFLIVVCFALAMIMLRPAFLALTVSVLSVSSDMAVTLWGMCMFLMGYLFSSASGTLVVGAFYAMGDTYTPVKVGVAGFLASLAIKAAGYTFFDLPGLLLAISAYYVINMMVLGYLLEKCLGKKIRQPV